MQHPQALSTPSPYLFRDIVAHTRYASQRPDFVDSRTLHAHADDIPVPVPAPRFTSIEPIPTLEDEHPWLIDLYVYTGVGAVLLSALFPYWVQP